MHQMIRNWSAVIVVDALVDDADEAHCNVVFPC